MRIGDILLTIPVAIEGLSERKEFQISPMGNAEFQRIVAREIPRYVGYQALPAFAAQRLQSALAELTPKLVSRIRDDGEREKPLWEFADDTATRLLTILAESPAADEKLVVDRQHDEVAKRIHELGIGLVSGVVEKPVIDQLTVIADAARLREQRPEDIVRIQLKIVEDGVEWQTTTRDDGSVDRRLIPE
jgi:hypothetical protein